MTWPRDRAHVGAHPPDRGRGAAEAARARGRSGSLLCRRPRSSTTRITPARSNERSSSGTRHTSTCYWFHSLNERVPYASSAPERQPDMSGKTTKKASGRKPRPPQDDMRREYRFDYRKARPNRFAAMLKGGTTAVVLDPDVASVFESPESVNRLLRSVIAALPANVKPRRPRG